jgi:hypothetical protein
MKAWIGSLAGIALLSSTPALASSRTETNIGIVALKYADMLDVSVRCKFPLPPSVKTSIITALMTIPDVDIASMELKIDAYAQQRVMRGGNCTPSDQTLFNHTLDFFPVNIEQLKDAIAEDYKLPN